MIPPEQAVLLVEEVPKRLTLVSLNEDEYFETIHKTAEQGFTSGRVYDALLLGDRRLAGRLWPVGAA
jgi:hypothetical protein